MARHRNSEEWSRILDAYSRRTGSQAEFCAEHGICKSTLEYNLRKQRLNTAERSEKLPTPRIVELAPNKTVSPVMSQDVKDTELSFHHPGLGEMVVRCHRRILSEVITQLSESR